MIKSEGTGLELQKLQNGQELISIHSWYHFTIKDVAIFYHNLSIQSITK